MDNVASRNSESDWLRNLVDLALLFLMAVMVMRAFLMEGYMISTGSMAPRLLGLHKRVVCPSCGFEFAFGTSFDDSVDKEAAPRLSRDFATCPNCGQSHIAVAGVPSNHGDQLLVHKGVFDFRRPRRWESVVFRNPADPGEAYVKRVVGLPGESIQDVNGDIFIDGKLVRKDLSTVRDFRILVYDARFQAKQPDWRMPWQMIGDWSLDNGVLACHSVAGGETDDNPNILRFRNWRWSGGTHVVETPLTGEDALTDWRACILDLQDRPVTWLTRLQFDEERQVLSLHGVLPPEMQDALIANATSESFRNAIYRLAALSHVAPLTDRYGYNSTVGMGEFPVMDLMVDVKLSWVTSPAEIVVSIPVDSRVFRLVVDVVNGSVSLFEENLEYELASADNVPQLVSAMTDRTLHLEMSNFDHRILCAINGKQVLEPIDLPLESNDQNTGTGFDVVARARQTARMVSQQSRLSIAIRGECSVSQLKLFRDVYYTPGTGQNAIDEPFTVPADSYFVQGDNSPVSSDSRNWRQPCVAHRLLIGKPFVVHLPSRPGKISIGGLRLPIRIPDVSRIRYIH